MQISISRSIWILCLIVFWLAVFSVLGPFVVIYFAVRIVVAINRMLRFTLVVPEASELAGMDHQVAKAYIRKERMIVPVEETETGIIQFS